MGEGRIQPDDLALSTLIETLEVLRNCKPEERNELARRYAVAITELEKVVAYVQVFIVERAHYPGQEKS